MLMSYIPPSFNNLNIKKSEAPYVIPTYNNIIIGIVTGIGRRALFLDGTSWKMISDDLIGTGMKPLVFISGNIRPRVTDEGIPIIWLNDTLTTLPIEDYLII